MRDVRGGDSDVLTRLGAAVEGADVLEEGGKKTGLRLQQGAVEIDMSSGANLAFLEELDMLSSLLPAYLALDICSPISDNEYVTPISVVSTLSTLGALSRVKGWDSATTSAVSTAAAKAVMEGWSRVCAEGKVLSMIVSGVPAVSDAAVEAEAGISASQAAATSTARRLLSDVEAPTVATANVTGYTMHEIATYQIKLGSGLMLAVALLLSVCLFCGSTMQYTDDSLLFGRLAFKQDNKDL